MARRKFIGPSTLQLQSHAHSHPQSTEQLVKQYALPSYPAHIYFVNEGAQSSEADPDATIVLRDKNLDGPTAASKTPTDILEDVTATDDVPDSALTPRVAKATETCSLEPYEDEDDNQDDVESSEDDETGPVDLDRQVDTRMTSTPLAHLDLAIDHSDSMISCQRLLLDIIVKNESLYNE